MRIVTLIGAFAFLLESMAAGYCGVTDDQANEVARSIVYRDPKPDDYMIDWLVCGPFTVEESNEAPEEVEPLKKSFTHDFLTGYGGEAKIEPMPGMIHHRRGKEYVWQRVAGRKDFISFIDLYGLKQHAIAYAYAEIEMAARASAVLGIGSDDGVKVWLNGEVVHENWLFRSFAVDADRIPISLRQGRNRLLIKVQNGYNPPWGFACRLMSQRAINRAFIVAAGDWWSPDPSSMRALLDRMEPDLAAGSAQIARNWPLEAFIKPSYRESCFRKINLSLSPALRHRLGTAGEQLSAMARELPTASQSAAYSVAAWFCAAAGQTRLAMAGCEAALRLPGDDEGVAFLLAKLRYQAGGKRGRPPIHEYLKWEVARQQMPGLSVAVIQDGKLVLEKGYGLANVELSFPATKDTVYRLASLSKPFTASAIMLLVEEGRISLEDPIGKVLPNIPTAWSQIRVRHLLTHTAGLPDYLNEVPAPPGGYRRETTPEEIIQMIADLPLRFPPGEQWHYDNTAFVLLRLIIERVSRTPYAEFMTERIFKPLGMTATRVYSFKDIIKNRAGGYAWEENSTLRNSNDLDPSWGTSGAELASTAADLVKFDSALYTEKLLKKSTLDQMWTPTKLNNGETVDWGIGWVLGNYGVYKKQGHEGSARGVVTLFLRIPEAKYAVVLLIPLYDVSARDMAAQITDLYLPDSKPLADNDPQTTRRMKGALLSFAEGQTAPALFTPEAQATLLPEMKQTSGFYQSLGTLRAFQLIEQTNAEKTRKYRYRTVFQYTTWIHTFVVTEENKIAEWSVEAE